MPTWAECAPSGSFILGSQAERRPKVVLCAHGTPLAACVGLIRRVLTPNAKTNLLTCRDVSPYCRGTADSATGRLDRVVGDSHVRFSVTEQRQHLLRTVKINKNGGFEKGSQVKTEKTYLNQGP